MKKREFETALLELLGLGETAVCELTLKIHPKRLPQVEATFELLNVADDKVTHLGLVTKKYELTLKEDVQ